ncbi:uncharacterized protein FOMMEDRAFT_114877 [Fomitiporia mediterranea MF3/22]|uniref:uncharacterized protein n=1 Tax=Fomitiporia mediterranea (strain MF3/22) TaxID=694068 RepID=UPI0004408440|nr:uncharacterized protein FOMMEDRAFT_114877 [Fomitiporia mediterranea MF3/22]EJC98046.1 hypothetical protein FOMMEDRAFT_114877 [Fomitiporia mediterranea MF3/22]
MYIAGIHVPNDPFASNVETVVCGTLALGALASLRKLAAAFARADATGGKLISLPGSWTGKLVTPTHAAATFVPVFIYLFTVPFEGFQQPDWIKAYALPDYGLDGSTQTLLRLIGCIGAIASWAHAEYCVRKLGQNWHIIGVREKPKIVNTGPYSIVRHPFYSSVIALEASLALMGWSIIPIYALGICAAAFTVKIPIEASTSLPQSAERLIESDKNIGPDYREYKKEVTSRFIPGIL